MARLFALSSAEADAEIAVLRLLADLCEADKLHPPSGWPVAYAYNAGVFSATATTGTPGYSWKKWGHGFGKSRVEALQDLHSRIQAAHPKPKAVSHA